MSKVVSPTLEEVFAEIDGWNESRFGAEHNKNLCKLVGFKRGSNKLSECLFEFFKTQITLSPSSENADLFPEHDLKTEADLPEQTSLEYFDECWRKVLVNEMEVLPYAEKLLKSGWNFNASNLTKEEYDVKDFLEERTFENGIFFKDLTKGQQGFFHHINRGFRSWMKLKEVKKHYPGFGSK